MSDKSEADAAKAKAKAEAAKAKAEAAASAASADDAAAAALAAPVDGRLISDAAVGQVSRFTTKPKITTDATVRRELIGCV